MSSSRLIKFSIFFIFLIFLINRYFFYTDFANACYLRIRPSFLEFSNTTIKKSIKILRYASPEDYQILCDNVKTINPNISCGNFGGGCFHRNKPNTIDVSTSSREYIWTVGIIVHEVCHVMQNKEGRPIEESECYEAGDKILKKMVEL